jgi:WD40 repeat protein
LKIFLSLHGHKLPALTMDISSDNTLNLCYFLSLFTLRTAFHAVNCSLKFFLSLYGHKLPALTMDISSDSTLLVTGSADKKIKVCAAMHCLLELSLFLFAVSPVLG